MFLCNAEMRSFNVKLKVGYSFSNSCVTHLINSRGNFLQMCIFTAFSSIVALGFHIKSSLNPGLEWEVTGNGGIVSTSIYVCINS